MHKEIKNIFHKNLFKHTAILYFVSVLSFTVAINIKKAQYKPLFFIVAVIAPFVAFFISNYYSRNIKHLLNQGFNRSKLLRFYFYHRTLKLFSVISIFATYILIMYLSVRNDSLDMRKIFQWDIDFLTLSIGINLSLYFIYIVGLFSANREVIYAQSTSLGKKKKYIIQTVFYLFAFTYTAGLLPKIPFVIIAIAVNSFLFFSSVQVINRTFRILPLNKEIKASSLITIISLIPLCYLVVQMKQDLNPQTPFTKSDINNFSDLGLLAPKLTQKQVIDNLNNLKIGATFEVFIESLIDQKYDLSQYFYKNQDKSKALYLLQLRELKYLKSTSNIYKTITHINNIHEGSFDFKSIKKYRNIFFKTKVKSNELIENILVSEHEFLRFIAIILKFSNSKSKNLSVFYKKNNIEFSEKYKNVLELKY